MVNGENEEALLMEELESAVMPLTEDEIEKALEDELKESLEYEYSNREKAFEVKQEIIDGVEKIYVQFSKPRGADAYEYLSDKEKEEYYLQYKYLIEYISSAFVSPNQKLMKDDLVDCATIGFVKALNSYKLSFSAKFNTYACSCMKNEIKSMITHQRTQVREVSSLDMDIYEEDEMSESFKDMLAADIDIQNEIVEKFKMQAVVKVIAEMDTCLTDKELFILKSYYEFDGFTKRSQTELGIIFHTSQVSISLILNSASKKLQKLFFEKFNEVSGAKNL